MPFILSANSVTFEPRGPGVSVKSTQTFADPTDEFRFRPGATKNGVMSAGITRVKEKDVVSGSDTVRKNAVVSLNIQLPSDGSFSQSEIDRLVEDLSEGLSPSILSRLLQGES